MFKPVENKKNIKLNVDLIRILSYSLIDMGCDRYVLECIVDAVE
jgi:hypothetical protein